MSDEMDHLECVEFASNAACIGEDVSLTEIDSAVADKGGPIFAPNDELIFSHMEEKCAFSPQQQLSDTPQDSEDESEDDVNGELAAFFETLDLIARTSGTARARALAALYPPTPKQLDATLNHKTNLSSIPSTKTSCPTGSALSPAMKRYLSRPEPHEFLIKFWLA